MDILRKAVELHDRTYGCYDETINSYTGLLDEYLKPNPDLKKLVRETKNLVPKGLKVKSWSQKKIVETIPKIVAHIFCLWTVKNG